MKIIRQNVPMCDQKRQQKNWWKKKQKIWYKFINQAGKQEGKHETNEWGASWTFVRLYLNH